jgi:hypothetical protein
MTWSKGFTLDGSAPYEPAHEDAELCHEGRELADLSMRSDLV